VIAMNEVRIVQNPCLGAFLIWRFAATYNETTSQPVPFPLVFVVLPILFQRSLRDLLTSTQRGSGFSKVIEKLAQAKMSKTDLIESINARAIQLRPLTLHSLRILIRLNLVSIDLSTTGVVASTRKPDIDFKDDVTEMIKASEKLGFWLSHSTLYQAALLLRVRF